MPKSDLALLKCELSFFKKPHFENENVNIISEEFAIIVSESAVALSM